MLAKRCHTSKETEVLDQLTEHFLLRDADWHGLMLEVRETFLQRTDADLCVITLFGLRQLLFDTERWFLTERYRWLLARHICVQTRCDYEGGVTYRLTDFDYPSLEATQRAFHMNESRKGDVLRANQSVATFVFRPLSTY